MAAKAEADFRTRLQTWIPKLVLSPSLAMVLIFVYGFIAFTVYVSFTDSRILPFVGKDGQPTYDLIGLSNYQKLFSLSHWEISLANMAVFAGLYIVICTAIGLMLAIFLDQKIRGEGVLRPLYLYPMALSFIVTGTAWKWMLDPGIGLENIMVTWGYRQTGCDLHQEKSGNRNFWPLRTPSRSAVRSIPRFPVDSLPKHLHARCFAQNYVRHCRDHQRNAQGSLPHLLCRRSGKHRDPSGNPVRSSRFGRELQQLRNSNGSFAIPIF